MTYTFKLARRLAVSRNFGMLPALLLIAACSGEDATSPAVSPSDPSSAVAVRVTPRKVMLATDQPIRFLARGLTGAGDSVGARVVWQTTGGTILPDGRFSAGVVGTYKVIGSNRTGDEVHVDTAIVIVVRRQPYLTAVEVRPGSISMSPGQSQNFTATGRNITDRVVPIGVKWSATGGTIDDGGTFVAGDSLGTYRVIAVNMGGTVADTATVVIHGPPPASPADSLPADTLPPAPAPPLPVLASVTLVPSVVTLAPSTKKQFKAYGRMTDGDSVAVDVVFQATGGTVTQAGLFTAGSNAGNFRIIASDGVRADTSTITVSAPLGSNTGIPFGSYECKGSILQPFSMCIRAAGAWSADEMNGLRAGNAKLILNQGGYAKFKNAAGLYDPTKYHAWVQSLKPYVESWKPYIADGTLMGAQVIDDRGPTNWGGKGITNQQVDEMAKWWKELVPGLATFVAGGYADDLAITGYSFAYLDGSISQYNARYMGDVTVWRDKALAAARTAKTSIILSLNVLAGGKLVTGCYKFTSGDPAVAGTCAMTPTEIRTYGQVLAAGEGACGLASWKTTAEYQALPGVTDALKYVGELASKRPATSCRVR